MSEKAIIQNIIESLDHIRLVEIIIKGHQEYKGSTIYTVEVADGSKEVCFQRLVESRHCLKPEQKTEEMQFAKYAYDELKKLSPGLLMYLANEKAIENESTHRMLCETSEQDVLLSHLLGIAFTNEPVEAVEKHQLIDIMFEAVMYTRDEKDIYPICHITFYAEPGTENNKAKELLGNAIENWNKKHLSEAQLTVSKVKDKAAQLALDNRVKVCIPEYYSESDSVVCILEKNIPYHLKTNNRPL